MTTLTMSAAPSTIKAANDKGKERDTPKTMVASPKAATEANMVRPIWRSSGRRTISSEINTAPMAGAVRSRPSPVGPASRMSRA